MRCLIAIDYPNFPTRPHSGRELQGANSEVGSVLKLLGEKVANCGLPAGDTVLDRPSGLTATMRVELAAAPADAA